MTHYSQLREARAAHTPVLVPESQCLYVLELQNFAWRRVKASGSAPSPRSGENFFVRRLLFSDLC